MTGARSSFPRGVVLGLTMAEVVLLVIFVLLLALAALLEREMDAKKQAENDAEEAKEELALLVVRVEDLTRFIDERGLGPALDDAEREANESGGRHLTVVEQAANWRELVRRAGPRAEESPDEFLSALTDTLEREEVFRTAADEADLSPETMAEAAEVITEASAAGITSEELLEAARRVAEAAVSDALTPEEIAEAARIADTARDALRERGLEPTPEAVEELFRDAERWRERAGQSLDRMAADLERAEAQVERLRAQARSHSGPGRGGMDHPSCRYRDGSRVAYLFDIGLVESGYLVRPAEIASDPAERAALPLDRVRLDRTLRESEFLEQTQALFDWSREEECRFFVRVFDHTPPDQKARYKELMRTLEGRFYKYAGAAAESPFPAAATGPGPPGPPNERKESER